MNTRGDETLLPTRAAEPLSAVSALPADQNASTGYPSHQGGPSTKLSDLVRRLEAENSRLRAGLKAVEDLIDDSYGVSGLHLNGDVALWAELRTGGRFEEWLIAFDDTLSPNLAVHPGLLQWRKHRFTELVDAEGRNP